MTINIINAKPEDLTEIKKILDQSALPSGDLGSSDIRFFLAKNVAENIGVIGLEKFGSHALLRSFAVLPEFRNYKVGEQLFNHLLEYCSSQNIDTVHLLTTTAEPYFARRGFLRSGRSAAPREIQSTAEFSHLCPSSSTYMVMSLSHR